MADTTVEIRIPPPLQQLGVDQTEIQDHLVEWVVQSRFLDGMLSSGQAARLLHLTRVQFLVWLRHRGIAYLHLSPDELAEEFDAVAALPGAPMS